VSEVRSKDGTTIAYDRSGNGPALVIVDGAFCSRAFGPSAKLAPLPAVVEFFTASPSTASAHSRR
jgi:hypothetical protein